MYLRPGSAWTVTSRHTKRRGIPVRESLIYHGDYTIQGGVEGLTALHRRNPHMTAVFVTNYEMTMGAVIGSNEMGISIPQELSVIGFDNLSFARPAVQSSPLCPSPRRALPGRWRVLF